MKFVYLKIKFLQRKYFIKVFLSYFFYLLPLFFYVIVVYQVTVIFSRRFIFSCTINVIFFSQLQLSIYELLHCDRSSCEISFDV